MEIKTIYKKIKNDIIQRINEFKQIGSKGSEKELFREFIFCFLTPQSNAHTCWRAAENLYNTKILFKGTPAKITEIINTIRFKNNKTKYIIEAREKIFKKKICRLADLTQTKNVFETREFIVNNFKGLGFKEASHFLRNTGNGKNIAILDRHILKNLKYYKVINDIPKTINKNKYYNIENLMTNFSIKNNIPLEHLDFVFWYKEKEEIFK
jgi:N-glycosylase/DNA lyase